MTRHRATRTSARDGRRITAAKRRERRHANRWQYPSDRPEQPRPATRHRAARRHLDREDALVLAPVVLVLLVAGLLAIPGSVHVAAADPVADVASTQPAVAPVSFKVCAR